MPFRCLDCESVIPDDGDLSAHLILCPARRGVQIGRTDRGQPIVVLGDFQIVGLADGGQIKCRRIDGEWYGMLPCDEMPKDVQTVLLTALSKARQAVGYEKPMKGKRQH